MNIFKKLSFTSQSNHNILEEKNIFLEKRKALLLGNGFSGKSTIHYQLQTLKNCQIDKKTLVSKYRFCIYEIALQLDNHFHQESEKFFVEKQNNVSVGLKLNASQFSPDGPFQKYLQMVLKFYETFPNIHKEFPKMSFYYDQGEQ